MKKKIWWLLSVCKYALYVYMYI